jgi:hypothetical protein
MPPRFEFISSYMGGSSYRVYGWGSSLERRFDLRCGIPEYRNPYTGTPWFNCSPDEFQRDYVETVDYILSHDADINLDLARAFNAYMDEQHQEALRHFAARGWNEPDHGPYHIKGVARFVIDAYRVDEDGDTVIAH